MDVPTMEVVSSIHRRKRKVPFDLLLGVGCGVVHGMLEAAGWVSLMVILL